MNRKFVLFSVLTAVALGAACALLWRQLKAEKQRERAAAYAAQAEAAARLVHEERLKEAEHERERVDKQNKELAELAGTLRAAEARQASNVTALTRQLKAGATNTAGSPDADAASGKGLGADFAKMMKDPAMKEMIRSQQKAMMKTMYGPLFKEMNLPADQQKQLADLILDSQMGGVENMGELFGNDAGAKTNAMNVMVEKQKKMGEDIKSLLGDERYAQYEDYQKSLGDRMVLNQFQQQSAGTDTALRDDQMKQLIQLMKEERAKVPPVISEDPVKSAETLSKVMNAELMEQQFKWQEDYNKRVFDRAGQVLTPEQLKEFAEFQEQQRNMQKLGLKMAREMFGGNKDGGSPPVAPAAK